jgi:DNA-binding LytR/AlgR family response regulator
MNIIIVEDEILAAENLELLIHSVDKSISVLAKIQSVRNAVQWLSLNQCDLIFLDIQLSDGNAFEIFEQIEVKTPVIFTTAYDQYAIRAFKHNSIDYLLKPINQDELAQSINKYKELNENEVMPDFKRLIDSLRNPVQYQERFLVSAGQKLRTVKASEIAFIHVNEKGVFLCTKENKNYDINYTLEKLEEILDPKYFFRINRQFIVNIDCIENMHIVSKSRLKLDLKPKPEEEVIVSVNNVANFKLWLNK